MISAILRGQLGNQMFQCATVIAHALKNNTTYAFPEFSGKRNQFPFMLKDRLPVIGFTSKEYNSLAIIQERKFGVHQEIPNDRGLCLKGYWQNYRYFLSYKEEIEKLFNLQRINLLKDQKIVSLHIRRGDSLRFQDKLPQPTDKYLNEAMEHFPGCDFLIFTDDLPYCDQKFKGGRFMFASPEDSPIEAMGLMSSCGAGHIIVNSTFSWMGAFFGVGKKVICPHHDSWFGDKYKHILSSEGLMVPWWTQIKY